MQVISTTRQEDTHVRQAYTKSITEWVIRSQYTAANELSSLLGTCLFLLSRLANAKPPLDAGFESLGTVVAVGSDVKNIQVGQSIVATSYGAFSEFQVHRASAVIPVPKNDPTFLPLLVSGLTASISLEQVGQMKRVGEDGTKQETVLVTAAAGGTGLFAVQLAKLAGHHVIATCSSDDKTAILKELGADRVINYKKENFGQVLKKEYPKGVDLVYESVGGSMFIDCVKNLAVKGRLIVIGFISGYADSSAWKGDNLQSYNLPSMLLWKSASIRGFFLNNFPEQFKPHMKRLTELVVGGKLKSIVDPTQFAGLEQVADAIDYMYKGANVGKVVVKLTPQDQQHKSPKSRL